MEALALQAFLCRGVDYCAKGAILRYRIRVGVIFCRHR